MTTSVDTASAEETRALGRRLGQVAEAGDVIALEGDLGTGKTELVKGIAEGLGVTGGVHSPTFVLHHRYQGRLPIEHYDLYRLEGTAWVDTGLDEPAPDAVTVIEWPDRATVLDDWATIRIRLISRSETERRLTLVRGPDRVLTVFRRAPRD
ncbi:MAG TPA: tRNA (adenosine(37)-N6)-threonylcarbamoyltransferase complex ATPase subunit type 1 TsaE [Candidatus Dormibacteraeota bacterium]|nr:tRNA (adenosine(37)-N6)-threonylcarbamoyltransferase complex ATPase subunit type 1 TsaE [Candidatus Dormibacteraeota bacterium]